MTEIQKKVITRSENTCEISGATENLVLFQVQPFEIALEENCILISENLKTQIENPETIVANDWRCLNESIWSPVPAVQVIAWRILNYIQKTDWAVNLLEMMYLDDDTLTWAKASGEFDEDKIIHKDSNGTILNNGDSVVLIKDLDVKGATFTAKRGAAVHNIKLVWDNANQIEGRVENQNIVILTQYVKKTK